jgi:hypothetical protein
VCEGRCVGDGPPKVWCRGEPPTGPVTTPAPTPKKDDTDGKCCYYSEAKLTDKWCATCEDWSKEGEYCGESKNKCESECVGKDDTKVWCPN